MPSQINIAVPVQSVETIRDAIGSILAVELAAQATLIPYTDLSSVKIYGERIAPVSDDVSINIMLQDVNFQNHSQISCQGDATFLIETYTRSVDSESGTADKKSAVKNWRIAGISRAVLINPVYKKLGLSSGIVEHREISSITRAIPRNNDDALSNVLTVMTMKVRFTQGVSSQSGVAIDQAYTSVKIDSTNIGLEYKYEAP